MGKRLVRISGTGQRVGQDHPMATLTDHEVELIRQLRADGMRYAELAKRFEVSKSSIAMICRFERRSVWPVDSRWVHVQDED